MTEESLDPLARAVPTARASVRRDPGWIWLVPLLALVAAVWLGVQARAERGPSISIRAVEGHGIEPGDPVRFRGIDVGVVLSAELDLDLTGVVVRARLERGASALARTGTRFWIVRPELSADGVSGLETVLGSRYIEALPGVAGGAAQSEFVALRTAPVMEEIEPGGLEIVLLAERTHGMQPGALIRYREIPVGRVLSVGLASDAADVEVRAYVRASYRQLVRDDTRFFVEGGLDVAFGLTGIEVGLDSLRSLVVTSIGMATPEDPGGLVPTGRRFVLEREADPEWLTWRPQLAVGRALLPADVPTIEPLRATLSWTSEKLFMERSHSRASWVLPVGDALVGPRELFLPPERESGDGFELEVSGTRIALASVAPSEGALARLEGVGRLGVPWPEEWVRRPAEPEDCLVIGDPTAPPIALSASRLEETAGAWAVDRSHSIDDTWHGAPVFSRGDGRLVGMLLVEKGRARIAPVP